MDEYNYQTVSKIDGVPDFNCSTLSKKVNDVALVIPIINEGDRIINQLIKMQKEVSDVDIIIADGGSTDGSIDKLLSKNICINFLLVKTGTGKLSSQLRMAIYFCLEKDYKSVITMDGNDKDDPAGLKNICDALSEGYDFVQGSRFVPGGKAINTPRTRYFAIKLVHAPYVSFVSKHKFTDTTNGFRGFSRKFLAESRDYILNDKFSKYELLANLPVLASRRGYACTEVPVTRRYPAHESTPTKIKGIAGYLDLMITLLKTAFVR